MAFGFTWAVPEVVKGHEFAILEALLDDNLEEAHRLNQGRFSA